MKRVLAALLAALPVAHAATPLPTGGVYRGTLGTLRIHLKLAGEDSAYHYASRGVDLSLRPSRDEAGRLVLTERVRDLDAPSGWRVTGHFTLDASAGTLRGTWVDAGGTRTLPVTLTGVRGADVPPHLPLTPGLQALRASDTFNYLRLNHPWPAVRAQKTFGGLAGVREPRSGTTYPRVPGAHALNGALQDLQVQDALNALACQATNPFPGEFGWAASTRVEHRTARTITLVTGGLGDCGGAHPFEIADAVTLDTRTGARVNVRGIWSGLTDPQLRALYLRGYPADAPDCRRVITEQEGVPSVYPTPRGLALWRPDLPHVIAACNEVIVVPYAQLRSSLNARSPYAAEFAR